MLVHEVALAPDDEMVMGAAAALANVLATLRARLTNADGRLDDDWPARSVLHKSERLVSELMAFAGRQHLEPVRVEVLPFLRSLAHVMRRALDARVEVSVLVDRDCPAWRIDRGALEEALTELAVNANTSMPQGGRLTFRASIDRLDRTSGTVLEIVDTGIGMSAPVLVMAATPFFTTKENSPLSGMGLPSVAGFAVQSGGSMSISSALGDGTSITLKLPTLEQHGIGQRTMRRCALGRIA